MRRISDKAEIRFVVFIQRSGNTNYDRVHFPQERIVGSGSKPLSLRCLDVGGRDAKNIRPALGQRRNLPLVDIKTGYRKLLLCIKQGEW